MDIVRIFDEKKFMWNGMTYDNKSEALHIKAEYEKNNFKVCIIQEEDKYFLFTRKIVTEIEVEQH
jgi:hypothetical protein